MDTNLIGSAANGRTVTTMKNDRLISLNAALDEVESLVDTMSVCVSMEECKGMRSMKQRVLERLKALPPAQPGWIPVTERLPKKDGDYLVTTHSGQIARYIFIGGSSEEYWRRCATAWMPLPTPYREEGQNDGKN